MAETLTVVRLTARLVRRGALVLLVCLVAYLLVEVRVFEVTYPDQASRDLVVRLAQDPVLQVFQAEPAATSIGALVVWDAGWLLQVVVGVWMVVATARVLRGDEDAGRTELMLAGKLSPRRVLTAQLGTLLTVAVLIGVAVGGTLALRTDIGGAALQGAVVAGFGATYVGATAVLAQVAGSRGRVLGAASLLLGGAYLLRMVAGSGVDRHDLAWLTPLGWSDRLQAYGDNHVAVLLLPFAVAAVLTASAILLRGLRDSGGALVGGPSTHRSSSVWLGGPAAFAWRANLGVLTAWASALLVFGGVSGTLIRSMETFLAADESYRQLLAAMGISTENLTGGYVAMTANILGAAICLYVVWRLGHARAEEAAELADNLLVRPVGRWRWLGGHVALTAAGAVVLALAGGSGMWLGARLASADLSLAHALAGVVNVLPVAAVMAGLAVLLLGLLPRLTVPVAASVAVLTYVLALVGPALSWPDLVVDVSPFHHLEAVPVDPPGLAAAAVMVAVAAVMTLTGLARFGRRDLVGA
ncbi:MAG TPA: hypothetical protein VGK35_01930 [Actinotalea sp.]